MKRLLEQILRAVFLLTDEERIIKMLIPTESYFQQFQTAAEIKF